MNFKLPLFTFAIIVSFGFLSCGGGKSLPSTGEKNETKKSVSMIAQTFRYRFYFGSLGSMTKPHDEIWIDTSGQMTYDTHQHMKDGSWKSPRGLAYLEPKDEDTLLSFIRQDVLFSIDESDVTPQCPDGDIYSIKIFRSDLSKTVSFKTNTCAAEFNLLTSQQRKIFPAFLAYINRMRDRYRPLYTD